MHFPVEVLKQCGFLVGPTAVGKTELSLKLAEVINAEIISLDSMALYRGMDIGTAKPSINEQSIVPHHMIDIIDPHEDYSTADYLTQALAACEAILYRSRRPLFVGGTGLYLRAILRGVFEGPAADWKYREELEAEAFERGPQWLWNQLHAVDSVSATRLHPNDIRRLIRALEIHRITGIPASEQQRESPLPIADRPAFVYWLHPPRDWLYDRINRRVERMFECGLIEETRCLLDRDPPIGRTARQALGYREVIELIDGRIPTQKDATELIQTRTRQFAKRQHTWFRNLEECSELPITGGETPQELVGKIV